MYRQTVLKSCFLNWLMEFLVVIDKESGKQSSPATFSIDFTS